MRAAADAPHGRAQVPQRGLQARVMRGADLHAAGTRRIDVMPVHGTGAGPGSIAEQELDDALAVAG